MVTWLWIPLTALFTAVLARALYLEFRVRKAQTLEKQFSRNLQRLFTSVLTDLRRPISSLAHVPQIFGIENNPAVSEYNQIVEECAGHTTKEIEKAKLFFEITSEQYELKNQRLELRSLLLDVVRMASQRHPERNVEFDLRSMDAQRIVEVRDPQLFKTLLLQMLNRLILVSPVKIRFSGREVNSDRYHLQLEAIGRPSQNVRGHFGEKKKEKMSDLLFADLNSSLDERLSAALCMALNATAVENTTPTGETIDLFFESALSAATVTTQIKIS